MATAANICIALGRLARDDKTFEGPDKMLFMCALLVDCSQKSTDASCSGSPTTLSKSSMERGEYPRGASDGRIRGSDSASEAPLILILEMPSQ
jgi:hypothetical protein